MESEDADDVDGAVAARFEPACEDRPQELATCKEHQQYLQEVVFSIHNQKMRAILWCLVRRTYGQSLGWAKWH